MRLQLAVPRHTGLEPVSIQPKHLVWLDLCDKHRDEGTG
ncbi:UNVERIFIED_ORG: hypothetical protein J2S29_000949 [Rhizobium sp. SLBN-170]